MLRLTPLIACLAALVPATTATAAEQVAPPPPSLSLALPGKPLPPQAPAPVVLPLPGKAPVAPLTSPPAEPTITWSTGDGAPGTVTIGLAGAPQSLIAYGPSGSSPVPVPLDPAQRYVLQLHQIGFDAHVLVELTLSGGRVTTRAVARTIAPRDTPAIVDHVIQVIPYPVGLLLVWLFVAYVRSVRREDEVTA